MSYILDALRRSDQDRKKGDVPNLQSQPDTLVRRASVPFKADRNTVLPWLLLSVAVLLLVWILPKSMDTDTGGSTIADTAAGSESVRSPDIVPVVPVEATQPVQLSDDDLHLDELKDVQLDISTVDEAELPVSQAPMPEPSAVQPTETLAATAPQREVVAEPRHDSDQSVPPLSASVSSPDPSASSSDPYEGIPHQRQLSYDLQNSLPDLNISVHMYSATPSSRLVRINNTIYREGDFIDSELKLEEITRDGLIMSIRNERFWQHAR
jgi:general secretion pathway protein B